MTGVWPILFQFKKEVINQPDKMKTIEGQCQKIQSQYAGGIQGKNDQLCQMLKKHQARLVQTCRLC